MPIRVHKLMYVLVLGLRSGQQILLGDRIIVKGEKLGRGQCRPLTDRPLSTPHTSPHRHCLLHRQG